MKAKDFFRRYVLRFPALELIIFALILAFDQITKAVMAKHNVSTDVLGEFLRFHYVTNEGAAFSFLADKEWGRWFFAAVASAALPVFVFFLVRYRQWGYIYRVSLSLVIAGALGNLIDRIAIGAVRDFISFSFFNPIFNIADSALTIGVVMLIIFMLFIYKDPEKKKKAETADDKEGSRAAEGN